MSKYHKNTKLFRGVFPFSFRRILYCGWRIVFLYGVLLGENMIFLCYTPDYLQNIFLSWFHSPLATMAGCEGPALVNQRTSAPHMSSSKQLDLVRELSIGSILSYHSSVSLLISQRSHNRRVRGLGLNIYHFH